MQKGNPPTERKIQRLFRDPEASRLIKRCNDFGAGGVSVAIGELADGLDIDLDAVPEEIRGPGRHRTGHLRIPGAHGRGASRKNNLGRFRAMAAEENLDATPVARVTSRRRLRMRWRGKVILDIHRDFLDSHGVKRKTRALVSAPESNENFFKRLPEERMEKGKTSGKPGCGAFPI